MLGEANLGWAYWGLLLTAGVGFLLATFVPTQALREILDRWGRRLAGPGPAAWALGVGALTTVLAAAVSRVLFRGLPTGVDEMASLLQARFIAEGMLAGPRPDPEAAFLILNTVLTPEGWVSLYPPSHLLLLAVGLAAGAEWLVGPILAGLAVAATAAASEILLGPARRTAARLGSLLAASSPFVIVLGAGYLSHVSAAAFAALTLWAALLARSRSWAWAAVAGMFVGLAVTSRPWTGLVLGTAFTLGPWAAAWWRARRPLRWLLSRFASVTAGGIPVAVAWFAYNDIVFGHPLRLGYSYAYGPSHGLGFHQDPWGNLYGAREAIGYTSANLVALGIHLLETPLPVVVLVAVWLAASRRIPEGSGMLVAWATLPIAANVFYWHHGFHLGPRMLYEAAPAWAVLVGLAAVETAGRRAGAAAAAETESGRRRRLPGLRDTLLWGLVFSAVLAPVLIVQRGLSYRHGEDEIGRFLAPTPPDSTPALVFVHGSWGERMTSRLQGDGMTLDSLETALRRNDVCDLQAYVTARVERDEAELPALDFEVQPGFPERLRTAWLSPGNRVLMDPGRVPSPRCRQEALADRNGVVSLAPLSWQGDLPDAPRGGAMFVRDLGPADNRQVIARHPERTPYMYLTPDTLSAPVLVPYAQGLTALWGTSSGSPPADGR